MATIIQSAEDNGGLEVTGTMISETKVIVSFEVYQKKSIKQTNKKQTKR